jgi:excinuclease ABC subunit B
MSFQLVTPFQPCGDQQAAIDRLVDGLRHGKQSQVLLGVTGSGKTFTMANVIEKIEKPTLIIAHNKTLAAQLYQEFRSFFPKNAVEYFVSYYDYYQPEAYIPRTDTYIEKDSAINDRIDKMRLSATRSLLERRDVIIVASVSCIYGLGVPEYYCRMNLALAIGEKRKRDDMLLQLVAMQYERAEELTRATFRSKGDVLDIFPAYEEDLAIRVEFFDDCIESIRIFDPLTGAMRSRVESVTVYAGSHHVTPEDVREKAIGSIREELHERHTFFMEHNRYVEAQRLHEKVCYDLELIQETGTCKGIENYSRHFSQRKPGEPPPCLLDYFPKDYLVIIDESHQTLPQLSAMCHGDRSRKKSLVEYGFRLPSAYDNRPLSFEEVQARLEHVVYVSATPAAWEVTRSGGEVVEQILRPTGLLDPQIEIRSTTAQVENSLEEIRQEIAKGGKILATTLTKRMAEELTEYLTEYGVRARYMHSDIDVLERLRIVHELRSNLCDVLVGINLLREGLDIPEVSLVIIFDADKEGFLRSETSLIQTCGRAARNAKGRVVMYADILTAAIMRTMQTTKERRERQHAYNVAHGIIPKTVLRKLELLPEAAEVLPEEEESPTDLASIQKEIKSWEAKMKAAAKRLQFQEAAHARDILRRLQQIELEYLENQ